MSRKILLTSVCRPLGPKYGDAPSVGYELLYGQVTRAQGLFSPRTFNIHYSLEYIAENLDAPTVVLQYPSKAELIRELKKGYDYVGVSFLLAVMHKMKETVALIRDRWPERQDSGQGQCHQWNPPVGKECSMREALDAAGRL